MKLFLDDIRIPLDCVSYMHTRIGRDNPIYLEQWIIARNYNEFVEIVQREAEAITHVSFDHDLADSHYTTEMNLSLEEYELSIKDSEETGYECAQFMKEYYESKKLKLPIIYVHSMNPAGRRRIEDTFK